MHRQAVTASKRILIKVGTSVVTRPDGSFALGRLGNLVEQIAELKQMKKEVLVVTSGSVGQGSGVLTRRAIESNKVVPEKWDPRACAAAGQSGMMFFYDSLFAQMDISCAQILLTDDDFQSSETRENLKRTLNRLLTAGIVPVLNENDVVSIRKTPVRDEKGAIFWDNDSLAALIATEISADLLLLLSDIEGIYNKRPDDPDARVIPIYRRSTEIIVGNKSRIGRGGIEAKIEAALKAAEAGIAVVIASGYEMDTVKRIIEGKQVGTLFLKQALDDPEDGPEIITKKAKKASAILRSLTSSERSSILTEISQQLVRQKDRILEANSKDIEAANQANISASLIARLKLSHQKLEALSIGIQQIAASPDPVGRVVYSNQLAEGLLLTQETAPLGLLLVIFESRPDAVPQLAALAIKSANGILLKGGKEAIHTNNALHSIIGDAIQHASSGRCPRDVVGLVHSREDVTTLLSFEKDINLVIPRGSNQLVESIQQSSKIPVLGHAAGICHIYLHHDCDIEKSIRVIIDAKLDYPSACNSVETLLINKELCKSDNAKKIISALQESKIVLKATSDVISYCDGKGIRLDKLEKPFHYEYSEPILAVTFVSDLDEAVAHINEHGSSHTDSILTESDATAGEFLDRVIVHVSFIMRVQDSQMDLDLA